MNIEQMLAILNPEIVERLKTAVEIGKWPNGIALTKEQREICMQAVIAWELKNLPEEQRSGYIDRGTKKKFVKMIITKMSLNLNRFVLFKITFRINLS
jgi:uncharacterized protein YeaC (DUF1315 family)